MPLLNQLLDEKIVKILLVLYKNKTKFYHVTQLSGDSKVPTATTLRIIRQLTKLNLVSIYNVGKFKIYKYNDVEQNNKLMRLLEHE